MFWCALAFIAIISPLIFWLMWREDFDGMQSVWRYYRACKSRQPLSSNEFHQQFYAFSDIEKSIVAGLREVCVEIYGVNPAYSPSPREIIEAIA